MNSTASRVLFLALLLFFSFWTPPKLLAQVDSDQIFQEEITPSDRSPTQVTNPRRSKPTRTQPRKKSPEKLGTFASSLEGEPISTLIVTGNQKIERDTILARIKTREGQTVSQTTLREDLDTLFAMGYFFDIQISGEKKADGVQLEYKLFEKPSMSEIIYEGNNEIDLKDLQEASGLKAYEILNMSRVNKSIEKMLKLYEDKGFFLARITTEITDDTPGQTVKLKFKIIEHDKVVLKRINILGNHKISDQRIKSLMSSEEQGFFSFLSGSGSFKQEAFDRDVMLLNLLYYNEGYVQVKVDRPQVYVSPDKRNIYITLRIEEGEQFGVGDIDFAGDLLFPNKELLESIKIKDREIFGYEVLQNDVSTIQAKYGDLGYAFANIIPRTRVREKERKVDITFEVEKGNKVYFGAINVVGNSRTRDKVVRRELKIREGELYNETRKRESVEGIKRLGFFEEVTFNTSTPEGHYDLLNIDISVKERNTGSIQVGAGYSSYRGASFNGQVNQANLFGRGFKLGASASLSSGENLFNINFTDPYFLDTNWSAGIDIYQTDRKVPDSYKELKTGGALRLGHPLARFLAGYLRYKYDDTRIELEPLADPVLFSGADGSTSSLTATIEYDHRDDRIAPMDGLFSSFSLEYAGIGGSKKYTKGNATTRYYYNVFWKAVFKNNLTYGIITPNNSSEVAPFNELFLLGGAYSLRGYRWFAIGKKRFSRTLCDAMNKLVPGKCVPTASDPEPKVAFVPYGGTQQLYYNAELELPLIHEVGIKGVLFYDIGNADDVLTLSDFRSDAGFGFRWYSPIGVFRFEWGFPFNRRSELGENGHEFNFSIGSPF